ncbi:hypothetical protein [Adhaeretor mobilis]|uniref:PEP-CTERM protein-sorting domain-containing protein n=1 Tax=Adhaeretor mobilis TaxID=1930276 RepID=A0A517MRR4_9BACT|nr:hypothetical protein [Adhaeretor mobilis]QDS97570.1 hypothetical protein HG15A2_08330 [Adhaeretor mobilis]
MQKQLALATIIPWGLRHRLLIPLIFGMSTSTLQAAPIAITNPGFEDISGESPSNEFTFGPLNGWDLYDPNLITSGGAGGTYFIGTLTPFEPDPIGSPGEYANFPDGAAEGQRVGIAFNFQGSDGQGEYGFEQVLNVTLQANTLYTLQVEIGNIDSATAMNGTFFPLAGFPGYRVDLFTRDLGGDENLDSDDDSLAGSISDGEFGTSTITFATGAEHPQLGEDLGIRLVNLNQLDPSFPLSDIEVDFDDAGLDASALTPGDLNADGAVNGADFLAWQREFPALYGTTDLANWETNYGNMAVGALSYHSVPESSTVALSLIAFLQILIRRRFFQGLQIFRSRC